MYNWHRIIEKCLFKMCRYLDLSEGPSGLLEHLCISQSRCNSTNAVDISSTAVGKMLFLPYNVPQGHEMPYSDGHMCNNSAEAQVRISHAKFGHRASKPHADASKMQCKAGLLLAFVLNILHCCNIQRPALPPEAKRGRKDQARDDVL